MIKSQLKVKKEESDDQKDDVNDANMMIIDPNVKIVNNQHRSALYSNRRSEMQME